MSAVSLVRLGLQQHRIESWTDAKKWLDTHNELMLLLDEDTWLQIILTSRGIYISGAGVGDDGWYTLTDGPLSEEVVDVLMSGNMTSVPVSTLVSRALADQVAEAYVRTGVRTESVAWVPAREAIVY